MIHNKIIQHKQQHVNYLIMIKKSLSTLSNKYLVPSTTNIALRGNNRITVQQNICSKFINFPFVLTEVLLNNIV